MIKTTSRLNMFKDESTHIKRTRPFLPLLLVCLIILAAITTVSRLVIVGSAQVCQSSSVDSLSRFSSMTRDASGFLHVTVNYSGGPDAPPNANTVTAMQNAVNEWNNFKTTTKVIFETAPAGTSAKLEFVYRPTVTSETGGCAAFNPASTRIYHGPELQARLTNLGLTETTVCRL